MEQVGSLRVFVLTKTLLIILNSFNPDWYSPRTNHKNPSQFRTGYVGKYVGDQVSHKTCTERLYFLSDCCCSSYLGPRFSDHLVHLFLCCMSPDGLWSSSSSSTCGYPHHLYIAVRWFPQVMRLNRLIKSDNKVWIS